MSEFLEQVITPGHPYEVEPDEAEELGAFTEDAMEFEDIAEAIEEEG